MTAELALTSLPQPAMPAVLMLLLSLSVSTLAGGDSLSYDPQVSADGNVVAWGSSADDLVPGFSSGSDVFVRTISTGSTQLASVSSSLPLSSSSSRPAVRSASRRCQICANS